MNYFFKYLLPQLMEYFNNDKETIKEFLPKVIESKNGWIKKEMYIDFDINNYNTVQEFIDDIVWDNNNFRPSYALNYKTPIDYKTQLGFK